MKITLSSCALILGFAAAASAAEPAGQKTTPKIEAAKEKSIEDRLAKLHNQRLELARKREAYATLPPAQQKAMLASMADADLSLKKGQQDAMASILQGHKQIQDKFIQSAKDNLTKEIDERKKIDSFLDGLKKAAPEGMRAQK
jgi:hypothetical protein